MATEQSKLNITEAEAKLRRALKERETSFIQERSINAKEFDEYINSILKCDEDILEELEEFLPEKRTHKEYFTALYEDIPNEKLYTSQLNAILPLFRKVNEIKTRLILEAQKELNIS